MIPGAPLYAATPVALWTASVARVVPRYAITKQLTAAAILTLAITAEAGRLFLKPVGQPRIQLFRAEDGVLFTQRVGVEITAEAGSGPAAPVKSLTLTQGGLPMRSERVKAAAAKKKPPARL